MKCINLNHWYIKNNVLSISLMRYYVKINICESMKCILFKLEVINCEREVISFDFYNLEEAIYFTEVIISKCENFEEIIKKYREIFVADNLQLNRR